MPADGEHSCTEGSKKHQYVIFLGVFFAFFKIYVREKTYYANRKNDHTCKQRGKTVYNK